MEGILQLVAERHQAFHQWEQTFNGEQSTHWMIAHAEVPVFATFLYVGFVFWGQQFMEKRSPLNLKPLVALWNLILSVFSIAGALVTVPYTVDLVRRRADAHWLFCTRATDKDYFFNTPAGAWVYIFILSKMPELLDTVFLVLQKKPVIFLHWFHHFTVMLFCWHSWTNAAPTGLFFATMNFSVHAIMYTYYFFMCFSWGRTLVRPFAMLITSLQIVQMIGGIAISVAAFGFLLEESKPCDGVDPANVKLGLAMYISYFLLFSALFKKLYLTPKTKPQATDSANVSTTNGSPAPQNGYTKKRQ